MTDADAMSPESHAPLGGDDSFAARWEQREVDALRRGMLRLACEFDSARKRAADAEERLAATRNAVTRLENECAALRESVLRLQPQADELARFKRSRVYRIGRAYYRLFEIPLFGGVLRSVRGLLGRLRRALR